MAQHVEPMDIDSSVCDFDNKENTSIHTNVLPRTPCTEKGYEELDVTELNMKLRYSLTPNMSKSYTACSDRIVESGDVVNNENSLTRSYNGNETKTLRPMPLQALSSESFGDGNRSALRPLDSTNTLDNACIITRNDDEILSLPSSSSSMAQTPDAITPTTEIPKSDGSPLMRGLKSVFNMFRPSQSPIPTAEGFSPIPPEVEKPETLSPPVVHSPETSDSNPQTVLASTPLAAYKTKDVLRRRSPPRESVVFNEDLETDLKWNDETTVIFSHEKIPLHKILFQTKPDSVPKKNAITKEIPKEEENLDSTVEYMDISYNDSVVKDKTMTEDDVLKKDNIATESDGEFVDCESSFAKNESFVDPCEVSRAIIKENKDTENNDELDNTITEESKVVPETEEEQVSLPLENTSHQPENKLLNEDQLAIDEQVSAQGDETNIDSGAVKQDEAKGLEDNGNVIDPNFVPQIDTNFNKTDDLDNKVIVSPVSPPLENVVRSSLSHIPLIADPRVLLFNISQNVYNNNDKVNAADVPLPDDNEKPTNDSDIDITDAIFVTKSTSMHEQKSEVCEEDIVNQNQIGDFTNENKSDSFVISTFSTLATSEQSSDIVSLEDIDKDMKAKTQSPIPKNEDRIENIPQEQVQGDTGILSKIENKPQLIPTDKGIDVNSEDLSISKSDVDKNQADTAAVEISTVGKEVIEYLSTNAEEVAESNFTVNKSNENVEVTPSPKYGNIDSTVPMIEESRQETVKNEIDISDVKKNVPKLTINNEINQTLGETIQNNTVILESINEINTSSATPTKESNVATSEQTVIDITNKFETITEQTERQILTANETTTIFGAEEEKNDLSDKIIDSEDVNIQVKSNVPEETKEVGVKDEEIVISEDVTPIKESNVEDTAEQPVIDVLKEQIETQMLTANEATIISGAEEKNDHSDQISDIENVNLQVKSKVPEETSEVTVKDEEIVTSEGNSPFVSVSADFNDIPENQSSDINEGIANPFDTQTKTTLTPPASPPIASKGYNFNFDEIEDPFATRTNIRMSPPPAASPNKTSEATKSTQQQKKDFNKNRRRSQPEKKKSMTNNKKMNSTFTGGDVQSHKTRTTDSKLTKKESPNRILKKEETKVTCEDNLESKLATENKTDDVKIITDTLNEEDKMSVDPEILLSTLTNEEKITMDDNISSYERIQENVSNEEATSIQLEHTTQNDNKEHITPSSSEQSTYFSADTPSDESVGPKSVFNLPEIDDVNFNRFATITKMKHSPTSLGQDTSNSSPVKDTQNSNFDVNAAMQPKEKELNEMKENIEDIQVLNNISGNTCSSKDDDEKNNTVHEVRMEDEDTVEGPFIEADLKDNKLIDFVTGESDIMNFDQPFPTHDNNADAGELFIDADAFEFLLNQNNDNNVADSGKESLFLKFDPLFAKRMSSDGVVAALSKLQTRQSTPQKAIREDATVAQISTAGPSKMNVTQEIDPNSTEDSIDELNITVSKPMMVVNPAVNAIVTPRNKTLSPVGSNRRSLTFTSPAIAVIDRLLSMSANNSLVHDATVAESNREQNEADVALRQLRELLADKEISVYNLRSETKELKDRLSTLETQMTSLENISETRLKNINELTEKLDEKTKLNKRMAAVVEEYERTIASLIAENEEDKRRHAEERMQLIQERDEQTAHLASMEVSFSDLHSKYEKSKQMILGFKNNEDIYRKSIKEFEESLAKMQANYESLKQHATSKLNHANEELQKMNKAHEAEMLKLNAMIKRKELHITSLEETLLQKTKANEELTAICDELINKVG